MALRPGWHGLRLAAAGGLHRDWYYRDGTTVTGPGVTSGVTSESLALSLNSEACRRGSEAA